MTRRRPNEDADEFRPKRRKAGSKPKRSSHTGWIIAAIVVVGVGLMGFVVWAFLVTPYLQMQRVAARRLENEKNLKQITLALHNYHDQYNTFPPSGIQREDGQYTTSWMTGILPYLKSQPMKQPIDFQRAMNDPVNQVAFSTPIPDFINPGNPAPGSEPLAHYAGNVYVFPPQIGLRMRNFTDGLSNTILVGDVSAGFKRWGDPTNTRDPGLGLGAAPEKFGSPFPGGCYFAIAGGSVRFVSDTIDPRVLKALATPDQGDAIDF